MDPVEPWIDGDAVRRLAAQLLSSPTDSEIGDSPDAGFGPGFEGFTSGASKPASQLVDSEAAPVPVPVPSPAPAVALVAERSVPFPDLEPVGSPGLVTPPVVQAEPEAQVRAPQAPKKEEPVAKPFLAAAGESDRAATQSDHPFQNIAKPAASAESESKRGPLMERMLRFRDWLRHHAGARSVFVLDRDGQPVLDDPAYAKLHFLARSLSQAYRPVPGQPGNVHVKVGSDAYLVVIPVETDFGCLVLGTVLPRPLDAPSVEIVAKALADAAKPRRK